MNVLHRVEGCRIILRNFIIYQTTQLVIQCCCSLTDVVPCPKYTVHLICVRQDVLGINGRVCCPYYVNGIASLQKYIPLSSPSVCIAAAFFRAISVNHMQNEEMLYGLFEFGSLEKCVIGRGLNWGTWPFVGRLG